MSDRSPEELDFPSNWDHLDEAPHASSYPPHESLSEDDSYPGSEHSNPPLINLVAASWADLVSMLAFCTAELIAVVLSGYRVSLAAFPWVACLALAWWCAAASVSVVVRRGTPGMLMAGVLFRSPVPPHRLSVVLVTAVVTSCLLGLPALLGPRRSPLGKVSGSELVCIAEP